jgi:hypothetical protein
MPCISSRNTRYRNRTQLLRFETLFASKYLISGLVRVAIYKVQNNFHNRIERRATCKHMDIFLETKKRDAIGQWVCGTARHAAANLRSMPFYSSSTRFQRHGSCGNVRYRTQCECPRRNSWVRFQRYRAVPYGNARYRPVSERCLRQRQR